MEYSSFYCTNGSCICKAIRDAGYKHHHDISHTLGMFLERVYKNDTDFQELSSNVQIARLKYNMQDVAYVQPPSQRSIARFMNMSKWIDWISRMQYVYHTLQIHDRRILLLFRKFWQFHAVIYRINDLDYGLAIILQTLCCTDRVGTRMCMGCINNDGS